MTKAAKRKKKSTVARLRPFWFLILIVAIVAGLGGYYAATWPGFFPKHVTIAGNHVVSSEEIAARARIASDANVWLQSMRAATARIDAIPYVKTAVIHRSLPASVRITVSERSPFAELRYGPDAALVDRDMRVLGQPDGPDALPVFRLKTGTLPPAGAFVKDSSAIRLRDDDVTLASAHLVVRSLSYDAFGDLVATTHGGIRLLLGSDSDLQKKTVLIGPILSQVAAGGRPIAEVDLRAPKTPVVVYR